MPDPVCISIVLCDQVIEDKTTGKKSLIGLFDKINCGSFPVKHGAMAVIVSLTDVQGTQKVVLRFTRDDPSGVVELVRLEGNVKTASRLDVVDCVFNLIGFPIAAQGKYTIEALSGTGSPLGSRHFQAIPIQKQGG